MDWLKILPLIAFLPHLLCAMVQEQPSVCSEYFTYMTKPGIPDMLGQIEIPHPLVNDEFYLKVALNTATELKFQSKVVRLELAQSIQESILAVRFGRSLLYHVYYPKYKPIPSLSAIWFNNHRYCPGPQANGNITATIELGHILYSLNDQPLVYNYGPWQKIVQPWHRNSSFYRIDNPSYDRLNYNYGLNDCGITNYYTDDTNRQIPNGEKTYPGQWPWFVAIYIQRTDNHSVYDFECTGSLLTTKHVITATYNCIEKWDETVRAFPYILPQRIYVSFGQLTSREWHGNHTGIINRVIAKYTYYSSLMILKLKTAIEYSAFIRPICLWSGSTNLRDIVNMTGYIVGWGHDLDRNASVSDEHRTFQRYTGEPRMIQVPLIEVFENPDEDGKLLTVSLQPSAHEVPCDLGGGIVVFNISTGSYHLLGVASSCVPAQSYIVYNNVAAHLSWIRHEISST